jgi:integrase/recombinase XerD
MMPPFQSRWSAELTAFLRFKHSLGEAYLRSSRTLLSFDRFAASAEWRDCSDIGAVMRGWTKRFTGTKPNTTGSYLSALRMFCLFRRRYDAEAFVPDRFWVPRAKAPRFLPYVFSIEEIQQIINATTCLHGGAHIRRGYRLLLSVLYCTGLRISEALKLRRQDLNLHNACFRVGPSKGRIRWVPFHRDLAEKIRTWLHTDCADFTEPEAFIFAHPDGRPWKTKSVSHRFRGLLRRNRLKPAAGRAGPRLHDLRHTMAVHRLQHWSRQRRDLPRMLPWLSAYLGHVNLLGTERYLHATPELLNLASRRLHRHLRSISAPS